MHHRVKTGLQLVGVVVVLALVAQGYRWYDSRSTGPTAVEGSLTLAGACADQPRRIMGTQVEIVDGASFTVGLGSLEAGDDQDHEGEAACVYPFTVPDVQLDEDFYGVRLETLLSNTVRFSADDLTDFGAHVVQGF